MRDAHLGAERQGAMRSRHGIRVEPPTRSDALPLPIVGGDAMLAGAARTIGGEAPLARRGRSRLGQRQLRRELRRCGRLVRARALHHLARLPLEGTARDVLAAALLGGTYVMPFRVAPLMRPVAGVDAPARPSLLVVIVVAVSRPTHAWPGLLHGVEVTRAFRPVPPSPFSGVRGRRYR